MLDILKLKIWRGSNILKIFIFTKNYSVQKSGGKSITPQSNFICTCNLINASVVIKRVRRCANVKSSKFELQINVQPILKPSHKAKFKKQLSYVQILQLEFNKI